MNEAVKEKYHSSSISFYQQQWIICALWSIVEVGFAVFGWLCLTSWLNFLTTNSSIRPSIPSTNHGGTQRLFIWSVESLRKVSSIEWSGWNLIPPLTGIDGLKMESASWLLCPPLTSIGTFGAAVLGNLYDFLSLLHVSYLRSQGWFSRNSWRLQVHRQLPCYDFSQPCE